MASLRDPEECRVAAVTGTTVKIYGKSNNGFRGYTGEAHTFSNFGRALEFARDFDQKERERPVKSAKK